MLSITLSALLGLTGTAISAPLRIMAIGDSMTEEYAYELPFSAPASAPTNANTRSWPELLRVYRPTEASLGPLEATGGAYGDLRNAGHEWNFGIPGMTTRNWIQLLAADDPFDFSTDPLEMLYYRTRQSLIDELQVAEVVVILLGANDLKQEYNDIFNNTEPANLFTGIKNRITKIHQFVRERRPNLPIVVCTVPDVGATPQISGTYSDPVKRSSTRTKIAGLNASIITWADATPLTGVARLDRLTDRLFDEQPFHVNGTVFTPEGHPENLPTRIFCRDNFHIATMAQALLANEIMVTINAELGTSLTPFANREILKNLLGLEPDQPYLTWATGLADAGMDADPDGDGIPNLAEFALGSAPGTPGRAFTGSYAPGKTLSWKPDPVALRFANLIPEESTDLSTWTPVPAARPQTAGDGTVSVTPAAGSKGFVRLRAATKL
ncbi:GDSL-type esterase/lipase family protein [Luteolibacter flavescens]|uniref:GDSL-type esterase/lipase family protein n=1 Tax=Luteolibacter flavescens TaxID=1859460 RepID=A0ABT3FQV4_9BACT|nr:SGNH/GDSL hydrolase family protein [Luteolibacter flavescens]MCW1885976.1 GDSL-type esterase/lipase family protein [Luteolibacter flavescens]